MSRMKCKVPYGPMITGHIINVIKTEIQIISSATRELKSVYGFGSFFRNEPHRDIDILAIIDDDTRSFLNLYNKLHHTLTLSTNGRPLDLLVLTDAEFNSRPLKCMEELTQIWSRD